MLKKRIFKFIALMGTVILIILSLPYIFALSFFASLMAQNQTINIIEIVDSPDGTYKAYVFEKNEGATTPFIYRLTILKNGDEFNGKNENTLRTYSEFNIEWIDETTLKVNFNSEDKIFLQKDKVKGVNIVYKYFK